MVDRGSAAPLPPGTGAPSGIEVAASLVTRVLAAAAAERGRATIAFAGGSTPRPVYQYLAADARLRSLLPWRLTWCFWGDERWVDADHPDNNARMVVEACLAHVPVEPGHVYPMPTAMATPDAAADAYSAVLERHVARGDGAPRFDLLVLGMGGDGHTLSLFPGSPALHESARACVAVPAPEADPRVPRLTLTPPLVREAAHVLLLVSGADNEKAAALARFDAKPTNIERYPIHLLREARGTVTRLTL